ncbi:MAG: serine/threonine protein kinase, partial [Candidatus Binatia bacterium]
MLSSNQVLHQGRYRIIDQFGDVESGRLYEAYDTVSNTKVVLRESVGQLGKVATAAQIENFKAAFAADAMRLADIEHPSLLKIRDYFSEIDRQYLVMESCEGSDLTSLILGQEKGPGAADILRWADQMLDGLHYLHIQDPPIVHRNVSPRNARLTSNFKVKLLISNGNHENGSMDAETTTSDDADLAYKSLEQLWRGLDSASRKMIANSFGEGSEEVLRQDLDARTDVYSVGAITYFLLTKTEPADALARYLEILDGNDDPLQRPTEINESIPDEISDALMKALELKREERFGSASEMRAELAKVKIPTRLAEVRTGSPARAEAPPAAPDTNHEEERLRV